MFLRISDPQVAAAKSRSARRRKKKRTKERRNQEPTLCIHMSGHLNKRYGIWLWDGQDVAAWDYSATGSKGLYYQFVLNEE